MLGHTYRHILKVRVFINTPAHTCMQLFVAKAHFKKALRHTHTERENTRHIVHPVVHPSPPLSSRHGEVDQSQPVSCHVNLCFLGHKSFGRQKDWLLLTTPRVNHGHALLTSLQTHKDRHTDGQ